MGTSQPLMGIAISFKCGGRNSRHTWYSLEEVDPNLPKSFSAKIDLDTYEELMQKRAK
jgi:hypothetical protein